MNALAILLLLPFFCIPCPGRATSKGTLVIVGGGGSTPEIAQAFLQGAGGRGGVVGVVPTSTAEPDRALKEWKADLEKAGLTMVPLDVRRREDASKAELLAAARRCTGFWFTGGDQGRVREKIVGTPLQKVIQERYREGAAVGGTSAGAAIMSRIMIEGEDRFGKLALSEFGPGAYRTGEGMAFLPDHVIVDQHFLRRGRQNRLFSLVMEHPTCLALGIDEATAVVVRDGRAVVVGKRAVMVFDPQGMTLRGESFRNLSIHLLRAGEGIDLATRRLLP